MAKSQSQPYLSTSTAIKQLLRAMKQPLSRAAPRQSNLEVISENLDRTTHFTSEIENAIASKPGGITPHPPSVN